MDIVSEILMCMNFKLFFIFPLILKDAHSCKELHTRSHKYALQNFQQVVGTEEFLLLPFEEVKMEFK